VGLRREAPRTLYQKELVSPPKNQSKENHILQSKSEEWIWFNHKKQDLGSRDLDDGRGFGCREVGAEERESGSEVPRSHAYSSVRSKPLLGCGLHSTGRWRSGRERRGEANCSFNNARERLMGHHPIQVHIRQHGWRSSTLEQGAGGTAIRGSRDGGHRTERIFRKRLAERGRAQG
jgi:hypothetical protein